MEQTKEKKYIVGSILCGLLTAFGIAATVISLADGNNRMWVLGDSVNLMIFCLIIYYAFVGYKKPHGNLLKYIILINAAIWLAAYPSAMKNEQFINIIFTTIEIGLLCYIAGRLSKAKENLILMILITAIEVYSYLSCIALGFATISAIAPLIIWLDICVAYFLRYKQHREAGLEDAPKK